ncbi:hypothetical protein BH23PSE1_BH23PSE1_17770 [soil metagenome]
MSRASIRARRIETVGAELDAGTRLAAAARLDALGVAVLAELEAQGVLERDIRLSQWLHLRLAGEGAAIAVVFADLPGMRAAFAKAHLARFGADPGATALVVQALECEARADPR